MISYLEGILKFKGVNNLIIVINGVGYKVFVPADIITSALLDKPASLFIHTHVKEDALDLYGFPTQEDLAMFELFLGVSGIGPKTALNIFSNGKLAKIKEAIVKGDVDFFTTVPRLGRKNAQKIIIELRSKLGSLADLDLTAEGSESKEIIEALKTFGFSQSEAKDALKFIKDIEGDTSTKIKSALKYLGKK
ncbi:Holliday junction branch migration protein RuvA [Candidatus Gottesmanbacteria bacterium]|nr:Holliday junction branch migration protein RuvA [Candidatus Gottesmanbacteria bacterium]